MVKKGGWIILADNHYGSGEYFELKKKTIPLSDTVMFSSSYMLGKNMQRWLKSKGFRHKVVRTVVNYGSKNNLKKLVTPFYGPEMAIYLFAKNKKSYGLNVSVFYAKQ